MADDLGQQRVERRAGAVARIAETVRAHTGAVGSLVRRERTSGRPHGAVLADGLQVDAGLDREAPRRGDLGGVETQIMEGRAAGQANLGLHEIDARDLLRDGVLDLQAGVGFDEHERLIRTGLVDEKLERAEVRVAFILGESHGRADDAVADLVRKRGRRRDLDDFLVATLDAALPLAEMRNGPVLVAEGSAPRCGGHG